MGEIERAWLPPCVVLVINDNPYGLMFALRYSCRFVYRHHFGSMCWIQEEDHRRNQGVCPICFRWRLYHWKQRQYRQVWRQYRHAWGMHAPPGLAVPLAVPPALPPGRPSVSLQRQYRRLRRQYRCWACRSSPGAGSAAITAAREALCVPTAAVPPSPAAVPELRDGFPRQKEPLEKNRRVQRHYRQDRR